MAHKKLKLLYIAQFLLERTDEGHTATVKDIIRKIAISDRLGEENLQQLRSIGGDVLPNQVGLF